MANPKKITDLNPLGAAPSDADLLIIEDDNASETKSITIANAMKAAPVQSVNGADGAVTFDYIKTINNKGGDPSRNLNLQLEDVNNLKSELTRLEAKIGGGGKVKPVSPPTADVQVPTGPYYFGEDIDVDGTGSDGAPETIVSYKWTFGNGDTSTASAYTHTLPAGNTGETKRQNYAINLEVTDNHQPLAEIGVKAVLIELERKPLEGPDNQSSQVILLNANMQPILIAAFPFQAIVQTQDWPTASGDAWNLYS